MNLSSPYSHVSTSTFSLNKAPDFQTTSLQNFQKLSDSGFESLNSNHRIHGDSSNWRSLVNIPANPSFDSPRLISHQQDIYVALKVKVVKVSTNLCKSSSTDHSDTAKSPSPVLAQEVKPINIKLNTRKLQGKTPIVVPKVKASIN